MAGTLNNLGILYRELNRMDDAGKAFEEGLAATVDWYRRNMAWVERVRSGAYRQYYKAQYDSGCHVLAGMIQFIKKKNWMSYWNLELTGSIENHDGFWID